MTTLPLPETLRTFVALDLPATTKQHIFAIQQALRARAPDEGVMYWPPLESFHLTLFYLGQTPTALRTDIEQALTAVGQGCAAFSLALGGLGTFVKDTYPWVFFVQVHETTGQLQALYEAVRDGLAPLGYQDEYPVYHPHITLCKAETETPAASLAPFSALAQDFKVPDLGTVNVKEMTFFHSVPDLASVYVALKRLPLEPHA